MSMVVHELNALNAEVARTVDSDASVLSALLARTGGAEITATSALVVSMAW